MNPQRWRRVGELFHEAVNVSTMQRAAWLDLACANDTEVRRELVSLLESDRLAGEGFVQGQVKAAVLSFHKKDKGAEPIQRVGPYLLIRELGRGGMGMVYLAERDDGQYKSRVAIKLVRPGMDTDFILHRFRRERQTLADLKHPNIAKLLDGGTTESGLPYIVLEYIDGTWITQYCQARDLGLEARLKLFLDVCSAVAHAHQNFVIHRDLKPGNILVDESGVPKLLDFGICKLLQPSPMAGTDGVTQEMHMMTPDYASPEQVRGDRITITSDVYSLAAVLYELLTGTKPHRIESKEDITGSMRREMERGICEREILRPGLAAQTPFARALSGDMDNILLRALQKDPQRRYASVEQFSEDLRRYLVHEPIKARPDSALYRLRKFARRRSGVLVAIVTVLLALLAGLATTLHQARMANERLEQVRRLANTFVFDVHDAVRDLPGSTHARQLIVETGQKYLDSLAKDSPGNWQMQSELAAAYRRLGDVQGGISGANLGNTAGAIENYSKALALLDSVLKHEPRNRSALTDRADLYQRMGSVFARTRENSKALDSLSEAARQGSTLLAQSPDDDQMRQQLADTFLLLSNVSRMNGDYPASLAGASRGVGLLLESRKLHPADRKLQLALTEAYGVLGTAEVRLGKYKEGLGHFRQSAGLVEELARLEPSNTAYQHEIMLAYGHIGDVLGNPDFANLGDTAGATAAFRRAVEIAADLHKADPADQRAANDHGIALSRLAVTLPPDQLNQRLLALRQSVRILEDSVSKNPQNVNIQGFLADAYNHLGDALQAHGDRPGARRFYRESLEVSEQRLPSGVIGTAIRLTDVCRKLGEDAARMGNRDSGLFYARKALAVTDPEGVPARARSAQAQSGLTPRGFAAMGLVYARLAAANRADAEQSRQDSEEAKWWLNKSLTAWRQFQSDPSFAPPHGREMERVEAALAELKRHP